MTESKPSGLQALRSERAADTVANFVTKAAVGATPLAPVLKVPGVENALTGVMKHHITHSPLGSKIFNPKPQG